MKQQRDSKKRIAFPIQLFAEGSLAAPEEIHVVPTGTWDHPMYGEMEITSADVAQFVQNFRAKIRKDLPITAGHDTGMGGGELPAIGWFKELIDRGVKGLYAVVEWTQEGKNLLAEGAFKYFSPEFYEEYTDPETQQKYEHVLVGGALTNKPYFKELEPVVAFSEPDIMNQFKEPMDINIIVAKKPEELSDDEKAFLVEHKAELSEEQKTTFASVVGETAPVETDEEKAAREAKEAADKAAADAAAAAAEAERQASEAAKGKKIVMSEGEAKLLREQADKGAKAFAELEKMRAEKAADKFIFSEANKEGRFLPKQKDSLTAFVHSLSEKQRDQFTTLVNGLPKTQLFGEIGDGGKEPATGVVAEVGEAIKKCMSENKLAYSDAMKKVFKENPSLAKRYNKFVEEGEDNE